MKYAWIPLFALVVGATGCGGAPTPPDSPKVHQHNEHGHHREGHSGAAGEKHHDLPPALADFHEALSPVWHLKDDAPRRKQACEKASLLRDKAAAVKAAPAPEGVKADDYAFASKELLADAEGLLKECEKPTDNGVDAHLTSLHEAFHRAGELVKPHGEVHDLSEPGPGHKP